MKSLKGISALIVSMMIALSVPGYALAQRTFVFDPAQHKWFAYQDGELVKSGVASGGANYCADTGRRCHTPVGTFKVFDKGGPGCKSDRYPIGRGGAPMPYCMHFYKWYAVHGSYEVVPGHNVSHGCIRIYPEAARWLSQNFINIGTTVIVKPY